MHADAERPTLKAADALGCNEALKIGCLAHCLALCGGIGDNGEARVGETAPRFTEHAVAARRPIFRSGERLNGVPIVCHGWAAVVATLPNNRRQIISILLPGDLVSGALVFEDKLEFAVEAVTEVIYHSYDRAEFRQALMANAELLEMILRAWAQENLQIVQLAVSLGKCTAEERVTRLLLNLTARLAQRHMRENGTFPFPLRQWHIAEITGLTPVHVNRVINKLRREGLIEIRNRALTIRDRAALERVCGM